MKVFKFKSCQYIYAFSGNTEEEAKATLIEQVGEISIDSVEEIPESEWDERFIQMWEDNDRTEGKPYKVSIRELIDNEPGLVYSNDTDLID